MQVHHHPDRLDIQLTAEDLRRLTETKSLEQDIPFAPGDTRRLAITVETPSRNPDKKSDAWFNDAVRRARDEERAHHTTPQQMSQENEPTSDI